MKLFVLLLITLYSFNAISQENREAEFDNGAVIKYVLNFDDPNRMYAWFIKADLALGKFESAASGLSITPSFNLSNKLRLDANLFLPVLGDAKSRLVNPNLAPASRKTIEFFPEIHYSMKTSEEIKTRKTTLKLASGYDKDTNYVLQLPVRRRKDFCLDVGINYSQFGVDHVFESNEESDFRLLSQGVASLSAGISLLKTTHYKITVEREPSNDLFWSSRLSLKFLLGAPVFKNVVRSSDSGNDIEIDPDESYENPDFLNYGFRISYDGFQAFPKRPNVFLNWGVCLGVHPSYESGESWIISLDKGVFYNMLKFGIGFGKNPG